MRFPLVAKSHLNRLAVGLKVSAPRHEGRRRQERRGLCAEVQWGELSAMKEARKEVHMPEGQVRSQTC